MTTPADAQPPRSLPVVLHVSDLQRELRCGKFLARRIAREIGRRIGGKSYVVHRDAFEAYLRESGNEGQATPERSGSTEVLALMSTADSPSGALADADGGGGANPFDTRELRACVARRWGHGGLTRLAEATGFSVGYIALIVRGYKPSAEARRRIFAALGPDAARAIGGAEGRGGANEQR